MVNRALEHARLFSKCSAEKALEAFDKLKEMGFSDFAASIIINIVPKSIEEARALLSDIDEGYEDEALGKAHITVNKNAVPNDPQSPFVTSGIRVGTPAPTTRGFKENEIRLIATLMCDVLDNIDNEAIISDVRNQVTQLCARFPVYPA